jgi:hypothetical protein
MQLHRTSFIPLVHYSCKSSGNHYVLRFILKTRFKNNGNLNVHNLVLRMALSQVVLYQKHKRTVCVSCDIT